MLPELRPEAVDLISRVKDFIEKECVPVEQLFMNKFKMVTIDGNPTRQ